MTDKQLPDKAEVLRLIDRLASAYGRAGDKPLDILRRAADRGNIEAKSLIGTVVESRQPRPPETHSGTAK